ncbi:hypothetical protein SLS55_000571 [Diplodia seriata]
MQAKRAPCHGTWYEADPSWPEWATLGLSCSSDSELSSLVSPRSQCGGAQAQLDHKSVWNVNTGSAASADVAPMSGMAHAQTSPAAANTDESSLCSCHPGEQQQAPDINNPGNSATYSQRTLRSHVQSNSNGHHLATTLPRETTATSGHHANHAEWPTPASPRRRDDDGYTRAMNGKRAREDDLLVQWKKAGMSYRQIREKGGFSEAESTLRGRYRTLTKRREERVRRPLWTQTDVSKPTHSFHDALRADGLTDGCTQVRLLREGVNMHVAAALYPGTDAEEVDVDETEVDANKVPWKKVAAYIWQNGGSYHFGNATCKKRWLKIQGML